MRHLREVTPVEVALMSRAVIRAAGLRALIPPTRIAHGLASSRCCALLVAVPLLGVTFAAEEKHLATPAAGHESQRVFARARRFS
jgi:hypothetical protein